MTRPRSSYKPHGTPGIVPSLDSDHPDWDAVLDGDGHVWVHFYAGIWDRLASTEMAARFVPAERAS